MLQKGKETGNMTPSSCNREAGILRTHNVTKMNHSETLRLGQPLVIFSVLPVSSAQWNTGILKAKPTFGVFDGVGVIAVILPSAAWFCL
ncbi:uncharacterized protein YALI1_C21516g [Yarrowia lipolytica]|uniref:Uncharacterized protein n=1 Tax=Yarrowia lipolytica TaxID=4952 RepID=A0A1D8NB97_YARLL|nr:hypothetical protein YALI1_C21516g [Yarrowia lipolytica]